VCVCVCVCVEWSGLNIPLCVCVLHMRSEWAAAVAKQTLDAVLELAESKAMHARVDDLVARAAAQQSIIDSINAIPLHRANARAGSTSDTLESSGGATPAPDFESEEAYQAALQAYISESAQYEAFSQSAVVDRALLSEEELARLEQAEAQRKAGEACVGERCECVYVYLSPFNPHTVTLTHTRQSKSDSSARRSPARQKPPRSSTRATTGFPRASASWCRPAIPWVCRKTSRGT
jgi:hypothetical protein